MIAYILLGIVGILALAGIGHVALFPVVIVAGLVSFYCVTKTIRYE